MQETHTNKDSHNSVDEINLKEFFDVLIQGKWAILSMTSFLSIIGVVYSLLLPNIYESKALLAPVNPSSGISGALEGYSAIAGLAGINLPSVSDRGNSVKALHKINSLSFFENNILTNIYLPDLMAFKSWNPSTSKATYDESIYDTTRNIWIRESYPKQQIPSAQESFEVFKLKHLSISEDKKSGFITILIRHESPFVAKRWAELIVNEVNNFYRKKDKLESEKAVTYLTKQISMTGLFEVKQVLAKLLEEETKKLTLIEANQSYVFDFIDPPVVMEKKSEPKRAIICILISLFGGMLSVILVLFRHYFFSKKSL